MAMKGLPWETNYCPKLTVFDSKKVRKFLRSQVARTIKFDKQSAGLLPNEEALDRHLRLLLWQGLMELIKDKARHKKESCKTFAELVVAARYGENEANLTQFP